MGLLLVAVFCFGLFLGLAQKGVAQNNINPLGSNNQYSKPKGAGDNSNAKSHLACAVKGKIRKRGGKKIYYMQGDGPFQRLKGYSCFSNEQSAVSAGYEKYQPRHRKSGDNSDSNANNSESGAYASDSGDINE